MHGTCAALNGHLSIKATYKLPKELYALMYLSEVTNYLLRPKNCGPRVTVIKLI